MPATEEQIARAVSLLRGGDVVAYPTDTIYGLGAVVWYARAVVRLYEAKGRPEGKPIPVLIAEPDDLRLLTAELSPVALELGARFWPGPLTLVVAKSPAVPAEVTSGGSTIGVRMPGHPLTLRLIRETGSPLATTSANLSGRPSPVNAPEVEEQLGHRIPLILDGGPCQDRLASTVVDVSGSSPVLLRPGPITWDQILAVLK